MRQRERIQPSVKTVLKRLETYIDPERREIEKRAIRILSLIPLVTKDDFIASLDRLKTSGAEKEQKERFQDIGTAYLLNALQAKDVNAGGDSSLSKTQQPEFKIRRKQIEAIVALLQKNHIQAATGFGKSSVIIPIASVIGALSENGQYAVVSVSPELKAELFKKIKQINDLLPPHIKLPILSYHKTEGLSFEGESQEKRFKQLVKAIVENPSQQEAIDKQQRTSYFEQLLSGQPPPFQTETQKTLPSLPKNTPSITLFEENDYVFYTMTDRESPFTHTIFDEIHVPRSRNTVYYKSFQSPFVSTQAVETYLFKRFLAEYFKNILEQVSITEEKGSYRFQDEAEENAFFGKAVFKDPNNKEIFEKAADFIAENAGLDKERLKQWLMGFSPEDENYNDLVNEVFLSLMRAKMIREGVHYQQKDGQQIVRDRFMGIALPSHRFSFDIQLGLQAWDGSVSFADYFENAAETVSFEGWIVHYLGGKISGLSGTLFTPTLTDPYHPKKTSLARFLEKQTQGQAIFIGQEKYALPPEPQVFENNQLIQQALFQQLQQDSRQTIIFCYDENEAANIEKILRKKLSGRQIILADASIDEEEARNRYQEFVNDKKAVLISTGRVGVGVDLKDKEGVFTDHKSIIYGLPWSIDQIYQALGRRRLVSKDPKNDFVWLISLDQVQKYDGYLSLEEKERKKILGDLNKPLKRMKIIERLIEICEQSHRGSDDFLVDFDQVYQSALSLYQEKVQQSAEPVCENILANLNLTPPERIIIERFFEQIFNQSLFSYFTNFVKAPSFLYWRLRDAFSYLIIPSSLGAEVLGILQSVVSEENINDWLEAKAADFEYFISQIILPQIRQIPNYNLLLQSKHPESIRFVIAGYIPEPENPVFLNEVKKQLENLSPRILIPTLATIELISPPESSKQPRLFKITGHFVSPVDQELVSGELYASSAEQTESIKKIFFASITPGEEICFLCDHQHRLIEINEKEVISLLYSSKSGMQIFVIFK